MAPSVADHSQNTTETVTSEVLKLQLNNAQNKGPSYPAYLPHFDVNEKFPPTEIFEFTDPALKADPKKPNLLGGADVKVNHLTPYLGTEISGVQISQLSKEGLAELGLYTAERKVLVFRDQDFKDIGPERQIEIAKTFGKIQIHPTSGNVKGYPEFHVVYRDGSDSSFREYNGSNRINNTQWHSDISYEKQTPGTTLFWILDQPETGGSTLFSSQVEAYNRLSPEFQKRLEGLKAVHSAVYQADFARARGGPVRREPVESIHPLVRRHPVTGEKALYVNQGFTRSIVGFKDEESEYLLKFLYDHIAKGADFHIRATYQPGTVVVWDNRLTVHSAVDDFADNVRRHAVRLTPQAEIPIPA
ncbi:hypothetical protein EIP91_001744 [Steccherinum ochraceum]|uniref:TauD/TfdA-like domain-containing protein n=1 Tax=Steccherinum ochraceum TaxID=92696 RepID=A0A4R0RJR1_9APHY|nr:hypothetical protein EIP91_001744 [Steccherinum ochraceum]